MLKRIAINRISIVSIGFLLIFLCTYSCTEREWANPFDDLDPATWAPGNLQVEDVSITEKKLTWNYENKNIEGFKLDRKKGDEVWQEAFQTLPKETRSFADTDITPDTALTYSYRLYAYAGKNVSEEKTISIVITFPAPTNLQTEKLSDKSYKLTWTDNSSGEQGFKIDRRVDAGNWIIGYGNVAANQITFTDTNVFRAVDVEYRVYGYYETYESDKIFQNINAALTAPSNLLLSSNNISSESLTWQDNSNGEEGFIIERKYEGGDWEKIGTSTVNNYTDNNFQLNKRVYYQVCSFVGQFRSSFVGKDFSSTITAPSNLQVTINQLSTITLTWQDNTNGEDGFKIDRKIGIQNWETEYATVSVNITTWQNTSFPLNETIYYRVYTYRQADNSANVEKSISTVIPAPTNLNAVMDNYSSIKLTWVDNSNGEEGFKIDRKIGTQNWELAYAMVSSNTTTWQNTTFPMNETIYYRIYGYKQAYNSTFIEKSVITTLPAPSNLNIVMENLSNVKLTWNDNSNGEDGFKIDRKVGTQNWETSYATVGGDINSWQNNSVPLNETIYYRVYAYRQTYNSTYVEQSISTIIPAPTNFNVVMEDLANVKLTWTDNSNGEEGFKIDRKIGTQSWETAYAAVGNNVISWQNTTFPLNETISYRIYAYKQTCNSSGVEKSVSTTIPAPTNLNVVMEDLSSVKLNWTDNSNGEEGFKIDRKINNGSWQVTFASTSPNSITYDDNTVDLTINSYSYRIYSFFGSYSSSSIEVTIPQNPCGVVYTINHTAGPVAPVDKTVIYGTVETDLTGSNKCWITQNLGADHQASAATDATEASAGWYWQFNKKQGYKHDGTNRTPNTTWISSIGENSEWLAAKDPCTLLLGSGWRLPTKTEWENADANGGWDNLNETFWSGLKLHAAGYLGFSSGSVSNRGAYGCYWSSSQGNNSFGWSLGFYSGNCDMNSPNKASGYSGRCLRDL